MLKAEVTFDPSSEDMGLEDKVSTTTTSSINITPLLNLIGESTW